MTILITGGAGFIGSNFINNWFENNEEIIINIDCITYAGNLSNLEKFNQDDRYIFVKGDICDKGIVLNTLKKYSPRAIINFAAESHVDRSIENPNDFIQTNIVGTHNLLQCCVEYLLEINQKFKNEFRFLHISTDEVYGSLNKNEQPFTENNKYKPNSPYSASKASSDHLVRSYYKTFNLPILITHSSNNYGPYQLSEKLIPLIINKAIKKEKIPIYGDGENIRDWLYVIDNCNGINSVLSKGVIGETYNIGGQNQKTNNEIANKICETLDLLLPLDNKLNLKSHKDLLVYVKDRPGHDRRYAINSSKIYYELGWEPLTSFDNGLRKTIEWYLQKEKLLKE